MDTTKLPRRPLLSRLRFRAVQGRPDTSTRQRHQPRSAQIASTHAQPSPRTPLGIEVRVSGRKGDARMRSTKASSYQGARIVAAENMKYLHQFAVMETECLTTGERSAIISGVPGFSLQILPVIVDRQGSL
ncbi:uncharacterized protein LOC122922413 isoform X2 [Bufo gargarizans]|uniref:uncharacterized protein LOC122922413 isoform X2 n=1 Tax=Bufo gargarizans TaxID=30331 RepID=UPI001CF2D107|nr:uncharacterized protein LOC122922413 isoform X2 [Bufo gargarizans]